MLMPFPSGVPSTDPRPDQGLASAKVTVSAADGSSYGGELPWQ